MNPLRSGGRRKPIKIKDVKIISVLMLTQFYQICVTSCDMSVVCVSGLSCRLSGEKASAAVVRNRLRLGIRSQVPWPGTHGH